MGRPEHCGRDAGSSGLDGDLMATMFTAMTLTNRRGIACEPKTAEAEWTLSNPCGLVVHTDEMHHPSDMSPEEVGRITGAHIHAHFLDQLGEYNSAGKPWTFSFEIHETTAEILGVSPIGGPGPIPW